MQIIPVLDIQGGIVVRAIGGRRSEYRPLVSRLTDSKDPLTVAQAIRTRHGFDQFYLADLDAIAGAAPAVAIYDQLRAAGFRLWVDAGVHDAKDVEPIADHADQVIIGFETVRGPEVIEKLLFSRDAESSQRSATSPRSAALPLRVAAKQVVFSLDLRDGQPLGDCTTWKTNDPLLIAERVVAAGIHRMIVLDLARVGTNDGTGTDALARALIHRFADLQLYTGGGVRDMDDLKRLQSLGVAGVLVSSALHDGAL